MAVTIEIRHSPQSPADRKSRAVRAADENIVVEIPDRCLTGGGVLNHKVWVAIAVKVGHCRPGRWLEGHSSTQSGGKGAPYPARSKLKNVAADRIRYEQIVRAVIARPLGSTEQTCFALRPE